MFKVLLIDDEEIIRVGLRTTIDWDSIDCRIAGEAEDGDEGLKMVTTFKPDIIFTDIRMPGLNGLELISRIKELKHECVIFILSGFRDFEYAQEAVRLGAFRFILKPTKTEELMQSLEDGIRHLKKVKYEQELFNSLRKKVKALYGINENDRIEEQESEPAEGTENKNSTYLVTQALNFMKANFPKDLTLKCVADELYISPWYLSKLLKKETGSTFVNLLNEIRIEEFKRLVADPKYKIYEIAGIVGFSDIPYFTKLFRKMTGMTPMEYKNRLK